MLEDVEEDSTKKHHAILLVLFLYIITAEFIILLMMSQHGLSPYTVILVISADLVLALSMILFLRRQARNNELTKIDTINL